MLRKIMVKWKREKESLDPLFPSVLYCLSKDLLIADAVIGWEGYLRKAFINGSR